MQWLMVIVVFFKMLDASAQTVYGLSGVVADAENQEIAIGDALLYRDGTFFDYAVISEGRFQMDAIPPGKYELKISCLGFEDLKRKITLEGDTILTFRLRNDVQNLKEVEVVAAKPMVTNSNGNLKIDLSNPILAAVADPLDVLSKLPGVRINPDRESLTILGKGEPLIYLGNQQISLEEFKALTTDAIASIEIVRNPSSKYEAEGRAVLLITRKEDDAEGANLDFSETLSQRRNFNVYNSLNGSLKRNKLTIKANFAYNAIGQWESHTFAFDIPEQDVFTDYLVLVDENDRKQIHTGGGLFYEINETDYLSLTTNVRLQTDDAFIITETLLKQGLEEDFILTETRNNNSKDFTSTSFNYNKNIGRDLNLFTGLQYSSFTQKLNSSISNDRNATGFMQEQERRQRYRIGVWAYRFDLEDKFSSSLKWELGANINNASARALSNFLFFAPENSERTDFKYSENTFASYANISGNLGRKTTFATGLRIENNEVRGETDAGEIDSRERDAGETESNAAPIVNRKNTRFFPKAQLAIEIDSIKSLSLDYGKSIRRPDFSRASSISLFINPFLEGSGNLNLQPSITDEASVTFQRKQHSVTLNYIRTKSPIHFTIGYDADIEKAVFSQRNLERETGLDLSFTLPFDKGIWSSTNFLMASIRRIEDGETLASRPRPYIYFFTEHRFAIGKDTTVSVGGWALTKQYQGIFQRDPVLSFNAGITRTFFEKLDCTLRFEDIARGQNFGESYSVNGVNANGTYFVDAQEIAFSIKYRFGRERDSSYQNKEVDENLDRID